MINKAAGCFGLLPCYLRHSEKLNAPPINGIASKRPCKYPLRMFSPFLEEKEVSEYSSVVLQMFRKNKK